MVVIREAEIVINPVDNVTPALSRRPIGEHQH